MRLLLSLPVVLCACAPVTDILAPAYEPQTIRVFDKSQYDADNVECKTAALAFVPKFSFGGAITQTVTGATANTSLIPISPLVPLYGAAGGAVRAASDGLDLASRQHANIYRNCLHDFTSRDRSAIVADPRD